MVYVIFDARVGQADHLKHVCGPYGVAQIQEGRLCVMEGKYQPRVIAEQRGERWVVHDGMGEGGPVYDSVRFASRPL
jgi:hypothetical protein